MKLLNMAKTCLLSKKLSSEIYAERGDLFNVTCENLERVSQYPALVGSVNLINYFLRNISELELLSFGLENQNLIKVFETLADDEGKYSTKLSLFKQNYYEELAKLNYKNGNKDFFNSYLYLRFVQEELGISKPNAYLLNVLLNNVSNKDAFFKAIMSVDAKNIECLTPIFYLKGVELDEENIDGYVALIKRMKETRVIDFFHFIDKNFSSSITTRKIPELKDDEYGKIMNLLTKVNLRANKLIGKEHSILSEIIYVLYSENSFPNIKNIFNFVRNVMDEQLQRIEENGLSFIEFLDIAYGGRFNSFMREITEKYEVLTKIVEYALKNNKIKFIELLERNYKEIVQYKFVDNDGKEVKTEDLFHNLFYNSLLNSCNTWEIINLNEINDNDLKQMVSTKRTETKCNWDNFMETNIKLTPKELIALHKSSNTQVELLYELLTGKIDDKLLIVRQISSLNYNFSKMEELELNELARKLSIKNAIRSMEKFDFNVSLKTMLNVLALPITFDKIIEEANNEMELNFIVSGKEVLDLDLSLNENIDIYVDSTPDCKQLLEVLDLSEDFASKYAENIKVFCLNGNATITMKYYKQVDTKRKSNLLKVVKAVLAGEMERFKFFNLKSEIEFALDTVQENGWKSNVLEKDGNMTCYETYDFADTMIIGECPTHSCMSYKDGSQNECLLANFDSNKKIVYVKCGETIIGRAIIRLTKSLNSNENVTMEQKVKFLDIDNVEQTEATLFQPKEQLTVFLERVYYAHANSYEIQKMKKLLVSTIKSKAHKMDARFIASDDYAYVPGLECKNMKVFISKTKNDVQYMDSFGGSNTSSSECTYKSGNFYL